MLDFLQTGLDGALFGTTYALIGIGFTLVFGVMRKINMSYAASSLTAAYVGLSATLLMPGSTLPVVFLSLVAGGLIGAIIYFLCFRFISRHNELASLMASVGALLTFEELLVHATNGMPMAYPSLMDGRPWKFGLLTVRQDLSVVFVVCVVAMAIFLAILFWTKLGMATRAVSQQPVAAQLCGIPLEKVNLSTFIMTGSLGGLAGALVGTSVGVLSPMLALPLTVKGLIVAVIGGLGSIPGAIIAGIAVGAFENIFQEVRGVTERDIYVMLLLFVFLLVRPNGLLGKHRFRD
jgi:branched-chain amino acid transport system permease protein